MTRANLFATAVLIALAAPVTAQQTCQEVEAVILQCPDNQGILRRAAVLQAAMGCRWDPLDLTCEVNFGCPGIDEVGVGEWGACACVQAEAAGPGPGNGGGGNGGGIAVVGGGLGGVPTCQQFLECPSGSHMEVHDGQCTCRLEMLPAFKD